LVARKFISRFPVDEYVKVSRVIPSLDVHIPGICAIDLQSNPVIENQWSVLLTSSCISS